MDKQALEKQFYEYRALQQQAQQLREQLESAQQQMAGIEETRQSVLAIDGLEDGAELQVPIANGVFVEARYKKTQRILVNVGGNAVVDRTAEQAAELIAKQGEQMRQLSERMQGNLNRLLERAAQLEKALNVV